jgi:hypothetical protein
LSERTSERLTLRRKDHDNSITAARALDAGGGTGRENAMALDTSKAYRLTNDTLGSGRSLDGTTRLTTASSDDGPGQRWRLRPQDDGGT